MGKPKDTTVKMNANSFEEMNSLSAENMLSSQELSLLLESPQVQLLAPRSCYTQFYLNLAPEEPIPFSDTESVPAHKGYEFTHT